MILNRNVIHDSILKQTLGEQVNRLIYVCDNRRLNHLKQKILALQNEISYLAYSHNQKLESLQSRKAHATKAYSEAIKQKKSKDMELKSALQSNRTLLSSLQRQRKEVIAQKNKNSDEEAKSLELAEQEEAVQINISACIVRIQQQQNWIKRLKAAEDLCKREILQQNERIKALEAQIKIQQIGNASIEKDNYEAKRQISNTRQLKQNSYQKIENEIKLMRLEQENTIKETEQLTYEKEMKTIVISEYEYKNQKESDQIIKINKAIRKDEEIRHELQTKIVNNMKLSEDVNNQIFSIKLNQTNVKIKNKELYDKIERLKRLKRQIINIIQ